MKATDEQINHILGLLEKEDIYCRPVQNFDSENEYGYNDYDDRIYLDGDITFGVMANIVDYLREQNAGEAFEQGYEKGAYYVLEQIEHACMNGVSAKEKYNNVLKALNQLKERTT